MPARTTRILVLGAVRQLRSASGYEVQSSLFEIAADRWAGLRSGSIYSMLRSLGREGLLTGDDSQPPRHRLTEAGERAHDTLLLTAIRTLPETGDTAELRAALHFAGYLHRDDVRSALDARLQKIEAAMADIAARIDAADPARTSALVTHDAGLEHNLLRAQADWLRSVRTAPSNP